MFPFGEVEKQIPRQFSVGNGVHRAHMAHLVCCSVRGEKKARGHFCALLCSQVTVLFEQRGDGAADGQESDILRQTGGGGGSQRLVKCVLVRRGAHKDAVCAKRAEEKHHAFWWEIPQLINVSPPNHGQFGEGEGKLDYVGGDIKAASLVINRPKQDTYCYRADGEAPVLPRVCP